MRAVTANEVKRKYDHNHAQDLEKPCCHPRSRRWRDPESGKFYCKSCGLELLSGIAVLVAGEKFDRGPVNAAVFRDNLGSTSKSTPNQGGTEPYHSHALASVYGDRSGKKLPIELLAQTCPNCKREHTLPIFADVAVCSECDSQLGQYVFQLMPASATDYGRSYRLKFVKGNGMSLEQVDQQISLTRSRIGKLHAEINDVRVLDSAIQMNLVLSSDAKLEDVLAVLEEKFGKATETKRVANTAVAWMRDQRLLQAYDPPDDDPVLKMGREILRDRLLGKISDEDAHWIGMKCKKGLEELSGVTRREIVRLIDSILEGEGVQIANQVK
jgi:hypothetical protein